MDVITQVSPLKTWGCTVSTLYYTTLRITNLTIVVREQSRESSYFEALLKLGGVRNLLSIKTPAKTILYSIFNTFQYRTNIQCQYQYQYGLILILNIDNITD